MVKSAARSLDLLELVAPDRDGMTLTEICDATGWPKSSTLGLLRTLRDRAFLTDGRRAHSYRLGPRVAWLGAAYLDGIDLVREGIDVVREVSRACDETVHLATLRGRDVHYLAKEEGTSQMRMVSAVGTTFPAHGTGVGKMLLSALDPIQFDALYPPGEPLPAITAATIVDRSALLRELAATRARGYALDDGESTVGLHCVAAPVLDAAGWTVAAMSVSVPGPRFTDDRVPALREAILGGARRLSERLGFRPPAHEGEDAAPGGREPLGAVPATDGQAALRR
jgi:DNA-binding IclR family transcriptional regulator